MLKDHDPRLGVIKRMYKESDSGAVQCHWCGAEISGGIIIYLNVFNPCCKECFKKVGDDE